MIEKITGTGCPRSLNSGRPDFSRARCNFACHPRFSLVCAAVIVLGGVFAAGEACTQDRLGAGSATSEPCARNRISEIPPAVAGDAADGSDYAGASPELSNPDRFGSDDRIGSDDQFAGNNDDADESPVGALLQHNCAELSDGHVACGLAVLEVRAGSPAAEAGLRPYSGLVHHLLGAATIMAAMAFPPIIAGMGLVEQRHVGEAYDLIIGVDGYRIRSNDDFRQAIADARINDVIYLTVVRRGTRLQIPVRFSRARAPAAEPFGFNAHSGAAPCG
jgi:hypothetical protein